jgi:hypothetical protein
VDSARGLGVRGAVALLRAYQWLISPIFALLGAQCRFHPSCSSYAVAAIQKYGVLRGGARSIGRVLRCHPLHPGGFDPP